jgi:hypothetical protein
MRETISARQRADHLLQPDRVGAGAELAAPSAPIAASEARHLPLDTIRGAMLLMMALNHIPTELQRITNHPLGFVSAAEGFVFLAGLLCGLVYTRRYLRDGASAMTATALRRALTIYGAHMASLFAVAAWVSLYALLAGDLPAGSPSLLHERPLATLIAGAVLIYQPGLLDILPLYCGFLVMLPLALWQLQLGRADRILWLSFGWWALTNLFDAQQPYVNGVINTGAFNFGAWQLLFIVAVVFGHAWAHGRTLLPALPREGLAIACLLALVLGLSRHLLPQLGGVPEWLDWLTNKNNLAPVRLLNIALLFYLVSRVAHVWPRALSWRPLAYLGRRSLPVFVVHIVGALVIVGFPGLFEDALAGRVLGPALLVGAMFAGAWLADRAAALGLSAKAE